jgi:Family of unknown function (DUF6165)
MKEIVVAISPGELLDKITILRIKSARIKEPAKLANVRSELASLEQVWRDSGAAIAAIAADEAELQRVNEALWDIEDRIRDKERAGAFDAGFVELARAVYVTNDARAAAKKRINTVLGSRIVEEKSYADYQR